MKKLTDLSVEDLASYVEGMISEALGGICSMSSEGSADGKRHSYLVDAGGGKKIELKFVKTLLGSSSGIYVNGLCVNRLLGEEKFSNLRDKIIEKYEEVDVWEEEARRIGVRAISSWGEVVDDAVLIPVEDTHKKESLWQDFCSLFSWR